MILDAWSLRLILNPRSLTLGAYHILYPQSLGKPVVSEMDEIPENFRSGGGDHFRSKKFCCVFCGNFEGKNDEFSGKGGGALQSGKFVAKKAQSVTGREVLKKAFLLLD